MDNHIFINARLKIERAKELAAEISDLIASDPPYTYALETNTQTNERATFSQTNRASLDKIVMRSGEVLHNLRSAIDYAYWETVSPHVTDTKKHKSIQFPFTNSSEALPAEVKRRLANLVSQDFSEAIQGLKPYAVGGNVLLTLIHETNIIDKHKFPVPVGDFTKISSDIIRNQVPDFPAGFFNCGIGGGRRDVVWKSSNFDPSLIGEIVPPYTCLFHRQLNVPVDLVFSISEPMYIESVITTFENMTIEVERVLQVMSDYI